MFSQGPYSFTTGHEKKSGETSRSSSKKITCTKTTLFYAGKVIGSIRKPWLLNGFTIWLFNIAMENGPFIDGLPIKNGDFPWLC